MKIATLPRKRRKDLITTLILLIGLPILVYASYQIYHLIVGAQEDALPRNVAISNLTHSSVTISWVTDIRATSSVIPIVNNEQQSPVLDYRGSEKRHTHYVVLEYLEPNTQYEFVIVSDGDKYSQIEGDTLSFRTASVAASASTPDPVHGSVSGARGDDVIILLTLKDKSSHPVSAIMPRGGNWIMDLAVLKDTSGSSAITISPNTNLVLIAVSGVNEGAVIEGAYSELFDSNGRLKDVYSLNIAPNTTLYSYLSPASILAGYLASVGDPIPSHSDDPLSFDPDDSFDPEEDFEMEDWESEEDTERRFSLVHDVQWTDMVTDLDTVTANTGESSIQVVNRTDTGFSVIWVSEEREEGYLNYGTSPDNLTLEANDERDGITTRNPYYVHMVSLSRLQPGMQYFFEVRSGNNVYDNGGAKYDVSTYDSLSSPPPLDSISGEIEGIPEHNEAVVLAQIKDDDGLGSQGESTQIATVVDENGRWILSIADSRTQDGMSYFEYTSGDNIYLDVLTTFPTRTHEEGMQGISDRNIEIILEQEVGEVRQSRVDFLDAYGVLGVATRNRSYQPQVLGVLETQDSSPTYSVRGATETPKTGIFDSLPLVLISIVTLVVILSVVYISKMTKKSKKGNMKKNI